MYDFTYFYRLVVDDSIVQMIDMLWPERPPLCTHDHIQRKQCHHS